MQFRILFTRKTICRLAAALSGLAMAGCAGMSPASDSPGASTGLTGRFAGDDLTVWQRRSDCFRRDVRPAEGSAPDMALVCSGGDAGADPHRTGLQRAAAYFNAASAYNFMAVTGVSGMACETRGDCHRAALDMIHRSNLNQPDPWPGPAGGSQDLRKDSGFLIRRRMEHARALSGIAASGPYPAGECTGQAQCLAEASSLLSQEDVTGLATLSDPVLKGIACSALELRADINGRLGPAREPEVSSDLRSIASFCPSLSDWAAERLAVQALTRADGLFAILQDQPGNGSVPDDINSITTSILLAYQEAAGSGITRAAAMLGLGRLYMHLAGADPDRRREYYRQAIRSFEAVPPDLPGISAELRAADADLLGRSYRELAALVGTQEALEHEALIAGAVRSFEAALSLAPSTARQVQLAEAYEAAHLWQEAMQAYGDAIGSAGPADIVAPALGLARLLEDRGDPPAALDVLTAALRLSGDPRLSHEAGRLRFGSGDHAGALVLLSRALSQTDQDKLADAHYMISVSETVLRRAGWSARAREHARTALRLQPDSVRYVRQECLVHLLGAPMARPAASRDLHCLTVASAEGWLLRGMLFLKQAQQSELSVYDAGSQERWRHLLRSADEAFLAGEAALNEQPAGAGLVWFDDLRREVDLAELLPDGRRVVARCRREITVSEGSATWRRLETFFGHYGVLKCARN